MIPEDKKTEVMICMEILASFKHWTTYPSGPFLDALIALTVPLMVYCKDTVSQYPIGDVDAFIRELWSRPDSKFKIEKGT